MQRTHFSSKQPASSNDASTAHMAMFRRGLETTIVKAAENDTSIYLACRTNDVETIMLHR